MATYATLRKESRTNSTDEATFDRKSGGAKWRDRRFSRAATRTLPALRSK